MIESYYLYNLLRGYVDTDEVHTVLEIGPGSANLAALLYHFFGPRMVLVDLPRTLCMAIPLVADLFPDASILMPHESGRYSSGGYDFVFLTPAQTDLIAEDSVDLAINTHSFQEMTHRQISEYFNLVQRVCKSGGYFFTRNRVEKVPSGPDAYRTETTEPVNRFAEYPWNPNNEVLVYEICRLARLVQLDDMYIRLERISK